jgi:hypothetical protein
MLRNRLSRGVLMDADPGAGGGDGKTAVLDEKRVTELINTTVNGAIGKLMKDDLPKVLKTNTESLTAMFGDQFKTLNDGLAALKPVEPVKTPDGKGGDKTVDLPPEYKAKFNEFEKTIKTQGETLAAEQKARLAAEQKAKATEKDSKVRSSLNQFTFATPEAAEDAFTLISSKVDFNDEGELLADGLLLNDFVSTYIPEKKPYLLASAGKGGSGASSGTTKGGKGKFEIEKIGAGMSADDQKSAISAILDALPNAQGRR